MTPSLASPEPVAIAPVGEDLRAALGALIDAIPAVGRRPTALARALDVNRVIVSRLLSALSRSDPLEVLQHLPGPDSLRSITQSASVMDAVPQDLVLDANERIERFGALIRDRFGTRGALNAAISDESESMRRRYEELARFKVYDGMRHVLGVEAETWLTSMIFTPRQDDDDFVATTTLHGALGMRRLRPDTPVRFTFGPPYPAPGNDPDPLESPVALQELYTNKPAPLETEVHQGQLVHRLAPHGLGKDAVVDMLAVSHAPRGSRRYASPDRVLGGVAIFADVPVKTLHCDCLVHESVFPGDRPQLIVYNPGSRGPANPNDRARDIDRVPANEPVEALPTTDLALLAASGVPNYARMLERVFDEIGEPPDAYRIFRVRVACPVYGFQYVLAFDAPRHP